MKPAHFLPGKTVRRAWPFAVSVDAQGRVIKTLPPQQPKRDPPAAPF